MHHVLQWPTWPPITIAPIRVGLIPSDDQFGPIILLHSHGWLSHFEASKCISSQPTSTYYLVLLSLLIEDIHQNHFACYCASKFSVNGTVLNAFSSTASFSLRLIQMKYDWYFIPCCFFIHWIFLFANATVRGSQSERCPPLQTVSFTPCLTE